MARKGLTTWIMLILVLPLMWQGVHAYGKSKLYGPYNAEVIRVIDGDTIAVRAQIFPHFEAALNVRIAGVDTPELRGKCDGEKILATEVKAWVENLFPEGTWVLLENVKDDKYSGRVVADVRITPTTDLGQMLLDADLAVAYDGNGPRQSWCE